MYTEAKQVLSPSCKAEAASYDSVLRFIYILGLLKRRYSVPNIKPQFLEGGHDDAKKAGVRKN
jgi:hypothetical protein